MENPYAEQIKAEKEYLKLATPLVEKEEDAKFFKEHKRWLQAGEALADTPEKHALVWFQYADLRNKITFLLFRYKKLTEEIEAKFFALTPIEEVHQAMQKEAETRQAKQAEVKKVVDELHESENKLDIFKAVCNGMSEEKAKEELAQYEKQLLDNMKGVA